MTAFHEVRFPPEISYGATEQLKLIAQGDFNFEGLSLRSTRAVVADLQDDVQIRRAKRDALGDDILDDLSRRWIEWRLERKERALIQWQAKLAFLERDRKGGPGATPDPDSTPDAIEGDVKSAEERARRLAQIERDLQR